MAPTVPRPLLWVSCLVVGSGVVMALLGAHRTGITWDEPFHVMRLRNFLEHGWFALDWALGGDGPTGGGENTAVYGPVTMLLLHGLTALAGVEEWGTVATSPAAYQARHLGVCLIGLGGTAAAAGITRIVLDSWRWALVTAAALLALPMWTGHLMFNVKDVPVATGYTLMTLALVSMVQPPSGHRAVRVAGLAAGIVVMVGTRPGMWVAVAAAFLTLTIGLAVTRPTRGSARTPLLEAATGALLAAAPLLLLYPHLFAHPALLVQSAEQSASFRDGQSAVLGYVPFHVVAQTPLLLLGLSAVGLAASIRFVRPRLHTDASHAVRLGLVLVQLCALPLLATARHSDLYNGLRQLLFATPAWAVLATFGLAHLLARAREHGRTGLVTGAGAVALTAPVVAQALLFPYQYAYFNIALDATRVHVPSDYWRASVPELLPRIPTDGQVVCGPTRTGPEDDPTRMTAGRYSSDSSVDCRTDPLGPLAAYWSARKLPLGDTLPRDRFYAVIDRDHPVPANCTRLADVSRNRHGRDIRMTYLARCHLQAPPLGAEPVRFVRQAAEPDLAPARWAYAPVGWVMRASSTTIDATGEAAGLTFDASARCLRQPCELILDAVAPADLTATVNDTTAAVRRGSGAVGVLLPPGTSVAWVRFTRRGGGPLSLRVREIRVRPAPASREAADAA